MGSVRAVRTTQTAPPRKRASAPAKVIGPSALAPLPPDITELRADVGVESFDYFEIVEPREAWPDQFRQAAGELAAVRADCTLRLDHIGSTAIPGLAAKDRLDIQLTTHDLAQARALIEPLVSLGYKHEPQLSTDRWPIEPSERVKLFLHRSERQPHVNLHVREVGRGNWLYALLFRDYLRVMPAQAAAYAEMKTRLAELADGQRGPYSYVKEPACDLIFNAASEWAVAVGWKASDYEVPNLDEFASAAIST